MSYSDDSLNPASSTAADRRILIIDDEAALRDLYADCLGNRYECDTASCATEGLELLAQQEYALVISDVIMPGLSGVELLREVTSRYPDTVVIMVSGVDRTQRVLDTVRLGAFEYLLKPCDLEVLELSVERGLERRALMRSARQAKQDLERRNVELARRQSELEKLQIQLVHSEKMASLGGLAAGVAHELNNPAGFIYGNMELMRESAESLTRLLTLYDSVPLPEPYKSSIAALKSEILYDELLADLPSIIDDSQSGAERIRDVVQNLRTFSRLDEAEYKKVDIHDGLESTLRLLAQQFAAQSVTIERDYGELPFVDCYAGQLNQVWLNLLVNAAHAVHARLTQSSREAVLRAQTGHTDFARLNLDSQGKITITTRLEDDRVCVKISDSGCGIAPEHLKKIFDPFFTTKPVGEGTGLGLSITYGIVERHHGLIEVESTQGVGTNFTVFLPVNSKHDAEREEEAVLADVA